MKLLTIIPARGGSKGIPDKNMVDICGRPLISYSIKPALKLQEEKILQKVIVSTDSHKIAKIAEEEGAEVPFLRPTEIAGDTSKSIDFIQHALKFYQDQNIFFDAVLLLQPTAPLRTKENIKKSIDLFQSNKNDSLISVYKEEYINDLVMYTLESDGITGKPVNNLHNKGVRRQEHGFNYIRNGSIYISSTKLIESGVIIGEKPLMYIMEKFKSINIDSTEDLEILRKIIVC